MNFKISFRFINIKSTVYNIYKILGHGECVAQLEENNNEEEELKEQDID